MQDGRRTVVKSLTVAIALLAAICPAASAGENLLAGGDFEKGLDGVFVAG